MTSTNVKHPDWDSIILRCAEKMVEKYDKYGNSWTEVSTTDLINRVTDEYMELLATTEKGKGGPPLIEKAHDLINQLGMLITAETRRRIAKADEKKEALDK